MKKYIYAVIFVLFTLSLTGCGSSGASTPGPASAEYAAAEYAGPAWEDGMEEAENEFESAVADYLDAQAVLLAYIQEAEAYLEIVEGQEVDDPLVPEIIRIYVEDAKAAVEFTVPQMQSDAEGVRLQTQDILDRSDEMWAMIPELEEFLDLASATKLMEANKKEIIMVRAELNTTYHYTVYGIDPETGIQRIISEFDIPQSVTANADGSKWQTYPMFIPSYSTRIPMRGMFSKDYTYLAVTRYSLETGEYRAGCYKEGEGLYYTDISKCIDAVGGDFDEPVKQMAVGFTEDGRFIFADMPSAPGWFYDTSEWQFSQVKLADSSDAIKTSLQTYDSADDFLMRGDGWNWMEKNWELTDWIDDTRCLVNYPEESVGLMMGGDRIDRWGVRIFDTATQELTSFIPGESRSNWSGVISPDGETVAFLSAPANATGSASLYTVPLTGGEPVKLCEDIPSGRGSTNYIITRPSSGSVVYFLLEWK
ncbi:MAG: hypothetical protein NC417_13245 [Candidatus Gastranaerophilales bacterium]|nr:hypothetical protein [Candidatus Gastranaerophilales bacterium]